MPRKRFSHGELAQVIKRQGYGIVSSGGGIAREAGIGAALKRARKIGDVEPTPELESLRAEKLSLNYSGKVRVRLKFYRRRLADYSRAISEKALVDCLQYAGLVSGDSEKEIWLIDEGQHKVEKDSEERTEIILEYESVDLDNLWVKAQAHGGR